MEEVLGMMGQAILAAIGAAGIIGLTVWLFFGTDGTGGPIGKYILGVLGSVVGG